MPFTENRSDRSYDRSGGLIDAVRGYLATWVNLFRTRLEIISTELEEEKIRLTQAALLAVVCLFCLLMGLLLVNLFIVIWFWETDYRMVAIGGLALLYIVVGGLCGLAMKRRAAHKPKLFSTTLSELAKDERALRSK